MNARILVFPLIVLLVGAGIGLWQGRESRPAAPAAAVPPAGAGAHGGGAGEAPGKDWRLDLVRKATRPKTEGFPARVVMPEAIPVVPAVVQAPVEKVLVHEGDVVKKGDLLCTLLGATYERALAAAEKAGNAPEVERAKKNLASLEVRAPEAGIVYRVDARPGERPILRDGRPLPLVVLFDWRRLSYEGTAPASLADHLAAGAEVLVQSGKEFPVSATVEKSGPPAPDGGIPIRVRPAAPPSSVPDAAAGAEILVVVGRKEVLFVPRKALRTADGRTVVYVVSVTEELVPSPVVPGLSMPEGYVEVSGVESGEGVAVWR